MTVNNQREEKKSQEVQHWSGVEVSGTLPQGGLLSTRENWTMGLNWLIVILRGQMR